MIKVFSSVRSLPKVIMTTSFSFLSGHDSSMDRILWSDLHNLLQRQRWKDNAILQDSRASFFVGKRRRSSRRSLWSPSSSSTAHGRPRPTNRYSPAFDAPHLRHICWRWRFGGSIQWFPDFDASSSTYMSKLFWSFPYCFCSQVVYLFQIPRVTFGVDPTNATHRRWWRRSQGTIKQERHFFQQQDNRQSSKEMSLSFTESDSILCLSCVFRVSSVSQLHRMSLMKDKTAISLLKDTSRLGRHIRDTRRTTESRQRDKINKRTTQS